MAGKGRADLLVGIRHESDRRRRSRRLQRANCMKPGEEAALHVAGSRASRALAAPPKWSLSRRAGTEDGVHVPDQQQPWTISGHASYHEIAELGLAVDRAMGDAFDSGSQARGVGLGV